MVIRAGLFSILLCVAPNGALAAPEAPAAVPAAPAAISPASDASATPAPMVTVASGSALKISLTHQLASNSAREGDVFALRAVDDVLVDGFVVIAKGALGEGHVVSAESAGGNGHPGKLNVQFDWIYDTDNLKVKLSDVPENNEGGGNKGATSTATIASYVLLGPLGLFAHNFVHGKDVIVKTDTKIEVYVAQTVHVVASTKAVVPDGFAH